MKKYLFFLLLAFVAVAYLAYSFSKKNLPTGEVEAQDPDRVVAVSIKAGDTFGLIMKDQNIPYDVVAAILATSTPVFDLSTIRAGKEIILFFDPQTYALKKLIYEPNTEEQVVISARGQGWHVEKSAIQYEIRTKKVSDSIHSSLYETALAQKIDVRAVIALAEVFAWQIDFAVDVREGDTFAFIYEERYRDNTYVMPGKILVARFNNAGDEFRGYYYRDGEREGYYDENGNSLQKILLKSPLQYRYISSGFSAARYNPAIHKITSHFAIDYAANYGTPAVTVGDGTVTRAGWSTGYGYMVEVRHNDTYTTRYGHFSRLAVRAGQKIMQADIVGYVGSTGWSTGPHLHYELYKNGTPINPLTFKLPPEKGLAAEAVPAFQEYIKQFEL